MPAPPYLLRASQLGRHSWRNQFLRTRLLVFQPLPPQMQQRLPARTSGKRQRLLRQRLLRPLPLGQILPPMKRFLPMHLWSRRPLSGWRRGPIVNQHRDWPTRQCVISRLLLAPSLLWHHLAPKQPNPLARQIPLMLPVNPRVPAIERLLGVRPSKERIAGAINCSAVLQLLTLNSRPLLRGPAPMSVQCSGCHSPTPAKSPPSRRPCLLDLHPIPGKLTPHPGRHKKNAVPCSRR
jgi:hypothetical protein